MRRSSHEHSDLLHASPAGAAQAATARSTALLAIVAGDLAASRAGPNACRQCDLAAENVSEAMHWLYQAGFAESECEEAL